jgi:hypothetical protein
MSKLKYLFWICLYLPLARMAAMAALMLVQVGLVALAHGDADAVAEVFDVGEGRADEGEAFAGVGLQETVLQQGGVGHGAVEATGGHVEVDFVLRAVRHDSAPSGARTSLGETVVDRTALHADLLALELVRLSLTAVPSFITRRAGVL